MAIAAFLIGLLIARQAPVRIAAGLALLLGILLAYEPFGVEVHTLLDRVQHLIV